MKRLAMVLGLFVAGAGAAMLVSIGTAGAGQTPTVQTVREQNVDAQGNIRVHEQGTPQVSLTGSPRVGLDPTLGNTVKLDPNANTVRIDPTAGAVPTTAADNPAFDSVVARGTGSADNDIGVYTVPAGHELVIEQASIFGEFSSRIVLAELDLATDARGHFADFVIPTTSVALDHPAGQYESVGDIQTRIYADPGTSVDCAAVTDGLASGRAECDISGYLVPVK